MKYLLNVGDGEAVEGKEGAEAANVTGPGGVPVRGSRGSSYAEVGDCGRRYPHRRGATRQGSSHPARGLYWSLNC